MTSTPPGGHALALVNWNIYLGADIVRLLDGSRYPGTIEARAAELWTIVRKTDFARRAGFIAARIAEISPAIVTLQEVFRWTASAGAEPAATIDHLELLEHELTRRGASYHALRTHGFTCEVPMAGGGALAMADSLVTLVRADLAVKRHTGGSYRAANRVPVGGRTISALRCWSITELAAPAPRIVHTHLEFEPQAQALQAAELLALVDGLDGPLLLTGDFNLDAPRDGAAVELYAQLARRGFVDAWPRDAGPGPTATQAEDLQHLDSKLDTRIDWILARDAGSFERARLLGASTEDRRALGIWPSDHAGITAVLATTGGGRI